jgi:hypothetical protein
MKRKRNRKKVNGFVFPAPFAGVVVLVSTFALGYVWLDCRSEALGEQLKAMELRRTVLEKMQCNEEYRWSMMKAPQNMERALAKHGIEMTWPREDQIVRLCRPRPDNNDQAQRNVLAYTRTGRTVMND